jgi:GTPase Era involved in 16S rRNA processing
LCFYRKFGDILGRKGKVMGKLGKKAGKNLQSVLKRKMKVKSFFKKKTAKSMNKFVFDTFIAFFSFVVA